MLKNAYGYLPLHHVQLTDTNPLFCKRKKIAAFSLGICDAAGDGHLPEIQRGDALITDHW